MKFLIQTIDGDVVHDFAFTLIQQIKSNNSFSRNEKIEYILSETSKIPPSPNHPIVKTLDVEYLSEVVYIPIGSVEFVSEYLKRYHRIDTKPLNVPTSLRTISNLGRVVFEYPCFNIDAVDDIKSRLPVNNNHRVFIKSAEKYKGFNPDIYYFDGVRDPDFWWYRPQKLNLFCSEVVNFTTEWRGFVHRHKLLDIQNYSGDPFQMPNDKKIRQIMGQFENAPIAYTIDVGVLENGETVLVEIHDFFSCGLYGFDNDKLPWMFSQWFHEYVKKHLLIQK